MDCDKNKISAKKILKEKTVHLAGPDHTQPWVRICVLARLRDTYTKKYSR